eukprot:2140142-Rhodomonas_salina.1
MAFIRRSVNWSYFVGINTREPGYPATGFRYPGTKAGEHGAPGTQSRNSSSSVPPLQARPVRQLTSDREKIPSCSFSEKVPGYRNVPKYAPNPCGTQH